MLSCRRFAGLLLLGILTTPAYASLTVKTCAPAPAISAIAYQDLLNCQITQPGESRLARFPAVAGEAVTIGLVRLTTTNGYCFRLISPEGTPGSSICSGVFNPGSVETDFRIATSGTYAVQVSAADGVQTLSYSLYVVRAGPLPPEALPLSFGVVQRGDISPIGDRDLYGFNGAAADTVSVTVSRTNQSTGFCFFVLGPDGTRVNTTCSGVFNPSAIAADLKLAKSGLYQVQVLAEGNSGMLSYSISLQCFGSCLGGPLTPVQNCTYTLLPASQVAGAGAATVRIGLATNYGCTWSATSNASFLSIPSGGSGLGPAAVSVAVAANPGTASRTGSVTVADQTATIIQSGTTPLLTATPSSFTYSYQTTAPAPGDLTLSLFTNVSSLSITASVDASWLTVTPTQRTAPGTLIVSANPAGLAPGGYSGAITIAASGTSSLTVPVSLTVSSSQPPQLSVNSRGINHSFAQGSRLVRRERISVENTGGGSLAFQAIAAADQSGNWLSVTPASGSATLSEPALVTVSVDPAGLAPGTYTGRISIVAPDAQTVLPVTVTVTAVRQTIVLSQTGLTFTAVSGGGRAPDQTFGVLNGGQGLMDWQVSASTLTVGSNWLSVTPGSGITDALSLTVPLVTVSVNHTGLDPGQYSGQLRVQATAADTSPQFVSVILNVLPAGSDPGPVVLPTGLIFVQASGSAAPAAQAVRLSNLGAAQRTYTSGRLTTDGATWFNVGAGSGSVAPNTPVNVNTTVSSTGLTPGIRRGVLTLLFQDGSVRTVNVLYNLLGAAEAGRAKGTVAADCVPTKLLPLISSMGSSFVAQAGWPNTLEARVFDDCGNPHLNGTVIASFSNADPALALVSLKNGTWTATWQPRNTPSSGVNITVQADNQELAIHGTATVSGGFQSTLNPPLVAAGAVLNAASYASAAPLAPGSIVSIFGSNLSFGLAGAVALPLETQLAGTTVTVGGKAAPLLYVSGGQINTQVPYGLPVNARSQVIVRRGDAYTSPEAITLAAAQPAVFTKSQDGKGQAIAVKQDGRLAEPASPAQAGDVLVFYCAGLGETNPPAVAGSAASSSPLMTVANPVTVTIGGQQAVVSFAGLVPGFTGLYQLNVAIPAGITGEAVPVVITQAAQSSPPVTIAVN